MIRQRNAVILFLFIIISFLLDQITKGFILNNLTSVQSPTEIIGSFLRFKLTYNPYGVFGISFGSIILYYILSFIGILVLIYVGLSLKDKTGIIVFGFIIGGAIGNVIDRLRFNYVIDFIDMGVGNLRWFTYNLADAFITVGAIFLLVREVFYKKKIN